MTLERFPKLYTMSHVLSLDFFGGCTRYILHYSTNYIIVVTLSL